MVVCIVAALLLVGGVVDGACNWNRAYAGVKIGSVDVSGMNADQIKQAVSDEYEGRMDSVTVTIFANEDARSYVNDSIAQAEDRAQAEQLSVEQARLNNQLWTTSARELGADIDYDALASEALAVGRQDGGVFSRIGAQFAGRTIDMRLDFDSAQLEHLAQSIDDTLGDARIDANVSIANGWAAANQGHDGTMVNRDTLAKTISATILNDSDDHSFIATVEDAPSRTTYEQAQTTAQKINAAIADGADFQYGKATWTADATAIGSWITTEVTQDGGSWVIKPSIQSDTAKPKIMQGILKSANIDPIAVSFSKASDDSISVSTSSGAEAPAVDEAASDLNDALFGAKGKMTTGSTAALKITVGDETVPEKMTLDEAISSGIVTAVGSFTTEFSTYSGTEARNHNIRLAAELINNSIVGANGGRWNFNEVAGDCNEKRGFQSAGTIIDGQYVDNIGGGICQVATTVFNAVYESGLDIVERHNHSLYLSSYPAGRDAAVSYPELTLIWGDETDSDVLLTTSTTESSVTVTLYSAPLSYTVSTETGEWSEGEKYKTVEKTDDSLAPGQSYVKTNGQDGKSITVIRYVKNAAGDVVKTDTFGSTYEALDEVVVKGPDSDSSSSGSKSKSGSSSSAASA